MTLIVNVTDDYGYNPNHKTSFWSKDKGLTDCEEMDDQTKAFISSLCLEFVDQDFAWVNQPYRDLWINISPSSSSLK